jgi:hypothetical protein
MGGEELTSQGEQCQQGGFERGTQGWRRYRRAFRAGDLTWSLARLWGLRRGSHRGWSLRLRRRCGKPFLIWWKGGFGLGQGLEICCVVVMRELMRRGEGKRD